MSPWWGVKTEDGLQTRGCQAGCADQSGGLTVRLTPNSDQWRWGPIIDAVQCLARPSQALLHTLFLIWISNCVGWDFLLCSGCWSESNLPPCMVMMNGNYSEMIFPAYLVEILGLDWNTRLITMRQYGRWDGAWESQVMMVAMGAVQLPDLCLIFCVTAGAETWSVLAEGETAGGTDWVKCRPPRPTGEYFIQFRAFNEGNIGWRAVGWPWSVDKSASVTMWHVYVFPLSDLDRERDDRSQVLTGGCLVWNLCEGSTCLSGSWLMHLSLVVYVSGEESWWSHPAII